MNVSKCVVTLLDHTNVPVIMATHLLLMARTALVGCGDLFVTNSSFILCVLQILMNALLRVTSVISCVVILLEATNACVFWDMN